MNLHLPSLCQLDWKVVMLQDHSHAPEEYQSLTTESAADGWKLTSNGIPAVDAQDFLILYILSSFREIDRAEWMNFPFCQSFRDFNKSTLFFGNCPRLLPCVRLVKKKKTLYKYDLRKICRIIVTVKTEVLGDKPVSVKVCVPLISYGLTRYRTQAL